MWAPRWARAVCAAGARLAMVPFLTSGGPGGSREPGVPAAVKARELAEDHRSRAKLASHRVYSFVTSNALVRGVGNTQAGKAALQKVFACVADVEQELAELEVPLPARAAAWRLKAQAFAAAAEQGPMALLAFSF